MLAGNRSSLPLGIENGCASSSRLPFSPSGLETVWFRTTLTRSLTPLASQILPSRQVVAFSSWWFLPFPRCWSWNILPATNQWYSSNMELVLGFTGFHTDWPSGAPIPVFSLCLRHGDILHITNNFFVTLRTTWFTWKRTRCNCIYISVLRFLRVSDPSHWVNYIAVSMSIVIPYLQHRVHTSHRLLHSRNSPLSSSCQRIQHLQLRYISCSHFQSICQPDCSRSFGMEILCAPYLFSFHPCF